MAIALTVLSVLNFLTVSVATDDGQDIMVINSTYRIEHASYDLNHIIVEDEGRLLLDDAELFCKSIIVRQNGQIVATSARIRSTNFSFTGNSSLIAIGSDIGRIFMDTMGIINATNSRISASSVKAPTISIMGSGPELSGLGAVLIEAGTINVRDSTLSVSAIHAEKTQIDRCMVDFSEEVSMLDPKNDRGYAKGDGIWWQVTPAHKGFCAWFSNDTFIACRSINAKYIWGLAFGGGNLWISGLAEDGKGAIFRLDTDSYKILSTYKYPRPYGLCHDGTHLWASDVTGRIYEIDPLTGESLRDFPSPDGLWGGLASDGEYLWLLAENKLYAIDITSGEARFDLPWQSSGNPLELCFHGGDLWMGRKRFYPISLRGGDIIVSNSSLSGRVVIQSEGILELEDVRTNREIFLLSSANLANVVDEQWGDVARVKIMNQAIVHESWNLDVQVVDLYGLQVPDADVEICRFPVGSTVTNGRTDRRGSFEVSLLSRIINERDSEFVGNYEIATNYTHLGDVYTSSKGIALKFNEMVPMLLSFSLDQTPPQITQVGVYAYERWSGIETHVYATVIDDLSGILQTTLKYKELGRNRWFEVPFLPTPNPADRLLETDLKAVIPQFDNGTRLLFYIEAIDNSHNEAIYDNQGEPYECIVGVPETRIGILIAALIVVVAWDLLNSRKRLSRLPNRAIQRGMICLL